MCEITVSSMSLECVMDWEVYGPHLVPSAMKTFNMECQFDQASLQLH
jgi:hypothetical protein